MLSVLIPVYNYDSIPLVKVIHQQCVQANIPFEIRVYDDASTLHNPNIPTLSNTFYQKHSLNVGRTQVRQILAQQASYDWLLFIDADMMPVNNQFIDKYINSINPNYQVYFGGYAYQQNTINNLRYHYGKSREEAPANLRNHNPYAYVFSGNMLIRKQLFLNLNPNKVTFYGMDIYFAHQLYSQQIPVLQMDNPCYHLGLETDEIFFAKALESVVSRKKHLTQSSQNTPFNKMIQAYTFLKKIKATQLAAFVFRKTEPYLRKKILTNHNLFLFDIYRLGYLCNLPN